MIAYNYQGIIKFRKTPKEYPIEMIKQYDPDAPVLMKGTLFQVEEGYMGHGIIDYIEDFLTENINNIEMACFRFTNFEDDNVPEEIKMEVIDNEYYRSEIERHIPEEYIYQEQDHDWLHSIVEEKIAKNEKLSEAYSEFVRSLDDLDEKDLHTELGIF